MKNSPEHVLKKMYTGEKRSWFNNCGFRSNTNIGLTHVVPIAVVPLTGNTTLKMEMSHYLQTQGTPLPLYEGMRVNVDCYFLPQRLYTRGLYGNNIVEATTLEQLPLPTINIVNTSPSFTGYVSYVGRGSLLNRLGVSPQMCLPMGNRSLRKQFLPSLTETVSDVRDNTKNSTFVGVNYALVAGYYDICRLFYSNKFQEYVPFVSYQNSKVVLDENGPFTLGDAKVSYVPYRTAENYSLSVFGKEVNDVRGVMNSAVQTPPTTYNYMAYGGGGSFTGFLKFGNLDLMDRVYFQNVGTINSNVSEIAHILNEQYSDTGLWPNRYDSHFQSMFFNSHDIDELTSVAVGSNALSLRLAEAKFATLLKSILCGRTVEDWIDVQYGNRLKINDKPIFVGSDQFMVNYQQIVSSAGTEITRLGDTASRGVGGTKKTYDDKGKPQSKPITFTTQEPGYLMVLARCTPEISYPDIHERVHGYTTLADFPLPCYSGKLFQSLKGSDFVYTGNKVIDNSVIGQQPYGFDHMTSFNRSSCLFATTEEASVFNRVIDNVSESSLFTSALRSVYVEPDVFDNNFYDIAERGRLPFKLISLFDIRKCMPLEKQVTDYNL